MATIAFLLPVQKRLSSSSVSSESPQSSFDPSNDDSPEEVEWDLLQGTKSVRERRAETKPGVCSSETSPWKDFTSKARSAHSTSISMPEVTAFINRTEVTSKLWRNTIREFVMEGIGVRSKAAEPCKEPRPLPSLSEEESFPSPDNAVCCPEPLSVPLCESREASWSD